jgi:hypothetical protein
MMKSMNLNKLMNSCNVLYRQIEIAKMTGVPTEMKSNIEMQKEL